MRELPLEGGSVDPGTPVTITAIFSTDPGRGKEIEVFASFMRPQESRAVVDPGYGQSGSRIRRVEEGVFTYVIDTTGFRGGRVTWHIWGADNASQYGWFDVNDRPVQLL